MSERFDSLKKDLSARLAASARAYLAPALERFHAKRDPGDAEAQALIGNFSAGIELTLKAFLAGANPALVYKDLPVEATAFFQAPEAVPPSYNWRPYELDLREFAYKTVSFEDAVRAFYVFFPDRKQLLRPYFKLARELKDLSLGGSLGRVEPYETEKAAYLALVVSELARTHAVSPAPAYVPTEKDRRFARDYDEERKKRVAENLAAAREKAKTLKVDITYNDPGFDEGWDAFDARCPVCKNWAFLTGTTDIRCEAEGKKERESLEFRADTFECDSCGLYLEDVEELKLADVSLTYDRSEDLAKWRKDSDPERD